MITNKMSALSTITLCLFATLLSTHSSVVNSAEPAGKTILAKGEVSAVIKGQEQRALKRRSQIFDADSITTGEQSKAQFNMVDGGIITLQENTLVNISEYQFNQTDSSGGATIELISGGLRSVSGLIKKAGGDYEVKTPVGSIGIRGTHFSVNVDGDDVYFGVFSGNIDITLANQQVVSIGADEGFSFAAIDSSGAVELLLQAPQQLSMNVSQDVEETQETLNESASGSESDIGAGELDTTIATNEPPSVDFDAEPEVYTESSQQGVSNQSVADLISERTGIATYDQVVSQELVSSFGNVSNFSMTMKIDFDNAAVTDGQLSFNDQGGEWFAAYSGLINVDQIELGVNFASHGNEKAQGDISAAFANGLDQIIGNISLSEVNNPANKAGGSYIIK